MNDMNQFNDWDEEAEMGEHFMNHVLCDLDIDPNDREAVDRAYAEWKADVATWEDERERDEHWDEEAYQRHLASEGNQQWNASPDGCYYCGGDHHSQDCRERY